MVKSINLLREDNNEDLWQMCCGFLDLTINEFMTIQNRLLLEQINYLNNCQLGRRLMNGENISTVEEFRERVPLTTYADYCDELLEKREETLPVKPDFWMQTSGRSGEYPHKWIPVNRRFWEEAGKNFCAIALLSCAKKKGEVRINLGDRLLNAAAHAPYLTGNIAYKLVDELGLEFLPPIIDSNSMDFEERVEKGIKLALSQGMVGFYGLAGVLVAIGEKFRVGSGHTGLSTLLSNPGLLLRLGKGLIKSKIAGRSMLPKDVWNLKLIVSMGTDCTIYRDRIEQLWGCVPLEVYGNTESIVLATQTWDYSGMVFFPNLNYLEFIPEKEYVKWHLDHDYTPKTVLLNEVKEDENYELVITNFHGGAMVRYRIGDMVRITGLRNDNLNIGLPQMKFERRADDLIDLGFMRLTERVVWQAIENAGIPYKDWTAHKIYNENASLHLYLELQEGCNLGEDTIAGEIYKQIKQMDDGLYVYDDLTSLEELINFKPITVTILPVGAFSNYARVSVAEGKSLTHLKPPHMNPSNQVLSLLGVKTQTTSDIFE